MGIKVLALDLATLTGVAVGSAGESLDFWTHDLGKGASEQHRFGRAIVLTSDLIRDHKPDLVAIEAAVGGQTASQFLTGLVACVRGVCAIRGVDCETFHIGSIRRHFVGKSLTVKDFPGMNRGAAKKAIKDVIIQRCRALGYDPRDDNQADAISLHDYACAIKAQKYQAKPVGGLFG